MLAVPRGLLKRCGALHCIGLVVRIVSEDRFNRAGLGVLLSHLCARRDFEFEVFSDFVDFLCQKGIERFRVLTMLQPSVQMFPNMVGQFIDRFFTVYWKVGTSVEYVTEPHNFRPQKRCVRFGNVLRHLRALVAITQVIDPFIATSVK